MRRKDREIKDFSKMTEVVEMCKCCRLGINDEKAPYILPLNFGYEINGDKLVLYFHSSSEGKKIDLLKKNNSVSFEMDFQDGVFSGENACEYSNFYKSVMGVGKAFLLDKKEDKIYALNKIMQHYTSKGNWNFDESILDKTVALKLEVSEWSCKEY